MSKKIFFLSIAVLLVSRISAQQSSELKTIQAGIEKPETQSSIRGNGMCFTQNKGQIVDMSNSLRPDILFKGAGGGADVYLRKTGFSYVLSNMSEVMNKIKEQTEGLIATGKITPEGEREKKQELMRDQPLKLHRIDVDFVNANPNIEMITSDKVEGYNNYYYAHCPQGITNVTSHNIVVAKNIYKNIDVKYYGSAGLTTGSGKTNACLPDRQGLKYDIIVNPGGDPNQIKLKYSGATELKMNNEKLIIETSLGELGEYMPKVYQNINGRIVDVKAEYRLVQGTPFGESKQASDSRLPTSDYFITFKLGTYNSSFPLVIDPWATYCGGSLQDGTSSITTDNVGNVAIVGGTSSPDFPVLSGFQMVYSGGGYFDIIVMKFDPVGNLLWSTFYGGSHIDMGLGIDTDISGNVIIAGYTSSANCPTGSVAPNVVFQPTLGGNQNILVIKFDPAGIRLWATLYGGSGSDVGYGIATDNAGNVIVVGSAGSANFPTGQVGANVVFQPALAGSTNAIVIKFDSAGNRLWATFYGGNNDASAIAVAIDSGGNVLFTGQTNSSNLPVSVGAFQSALSPGAVYNVLIAKFSSTGAMLWSTYYGGNSYDWVYAIATDNADNVIITGSTNSPGFPIGQVGANVVFQPAFGGVGAWFYGDAYLVKLNPAGNRLWATFYGGSDTEVGHGIVTDINNNIYLLMEAEDIASPNLIDACAYQPVFNGGSSTDGANIYGKPEDQQIVKFTPIGQKICATYLGGIGEDDMDGQAGGIAIYHDLIYITAYTDGGYPVTPGAFQTNYGGGSFDGFIASICSNICEGKVLALNYTASGACANVPVTFTPSVANSCDTTGYKFQWTFTGGSPASSSAIKPSVIFSGVGNHNVKLVVTTICKKDSITNTITITNCTGCLLTASTTTIPSTCGNNNGSATASGSGGTGALTYAWSNGGTTSQISNLASQIYTVTITDAAGCAATATANVIASPALAGQFSKGTANCAGCGCKEWVMVTASGGTSPYSYSWSSPAYDKRYLNHLCPGNYSVNITDKNGCKINVNLSTP